MPGTKGKSGGLREPGPGKKLGRPSVAQKTQYRRPPMTEPHGKEQAEAMEWWESLKPIDRTMHIKEMHYMCGWPKPHMKDKR